MGLYNNQILPRILNLAMGMPFLAEERTKCLARVRGRVLEVGFGAGHNLPHYPKDVERLVAFDPSVVSAKLARGRIVNASFPVEYLPLRGEEIPADEGSFDSAVSTFTLCTIPDPATALWQIQRVLKPGGQFFFLEHGRSAEPAVQRWQDRLNGIQNRLFGGCHLNRDIEKLIRDAGFEILTIDKYYAKGPKFASRFYRGVARRP